MDDAIRDFFDVKFDPPGRMSAGVSCKITLIFLPKLFKDIWTVFPILAKTGRIEFPIRCITKKTILDIEPKVVDPERAKRNKVGLINDETAGSEEKIGNEKYRSEARVQYIISITYRHAPVKSVV